MNYEITSDDSLKVYLLPSYSSVTNSTNKNFYILSEYALKVFVSRSRQFRVCDSTLREISSLNHKLSNESKNRFTYGIILGSLSTFLLIVSLKVILS